MRRHILLSLGLIFSVFMGCSDPSGPRVDENSLQTPDALVFGWDASISLETFTNGQDADEAPGPSIAPGDPVVWEYRLTNTGSEDLYGVWVFDDQEGTICSLTILAVGQVYSCTKEGVARAGSYANLGTVFGYGSISMVEDSDWSHYEGALSMQAPVLLEVAIRIKPGGGSPCVNPSS